MRIPGHAHVRAGRGPARTLVGLLAGGAVLLVAACSTGEPMASLGSATDPRVISIDLLDFRFEPAVIEVRLGESIRIVAVNRSDLPHELFVGSSDEQDRHHALHAGAAPDAQAELDDGVTGIYVPARGSGQFTYAFDEAGEVVIGCHLVGHFEAGMVGVIHVVAH